MKKILSVLLAMLMVLGSMTLLVSAAPAAPATGVATNAGVNSGHIFYQQSFDSDALASLTNGTLTAALGWAYPEEGHSLSIENGQLRIITKKTGGVAYTTSLVQDEQIAGNAITVEYKFKYLPKATEADTSAYLSVNLRKDADNALFATPVNMSGSVDVSKMGLVGGSAGAYGHEIISVESDETPDPFVGTEHTMRAVIDPGSDGVQIYVDGLPMTQVAHGSRQTWRNTDADRLIHDTLELMVQPGLDVVIDDLTVSEYTAALQITEVMANAATAGSYQYLEIHNPNTKAVNLYDYCVVVFNGCTSTPSGTIGDEVDKSTGTSQSFVEGPDGTPIIKVENTYAAWDKNAASTIAYFRPGAMKILVDPAAEKAEDRTQTFDNPAYADGAIAPGETALVMLPYTAVKGGAPVTDEAFREYATKLGYPEDGKLFACDNKVSKCQCGENCSDLSTCTNPFQYPCRVINLTNESAEVALMKVSNTSTDGGYEPVGIGYGQSNGYRYAFYESYVVLTSKDVGSGSIVAGFPVYHSQTVVDDSIPLNTKIYYYDENNQPIMEGGEHKYLIYTEDNPPMITEKTLTGVFGNTAGAFGGNGDRSFEISYGQNGDPAKAQKMGWMYYNTNQPRTGLTNAAMCHSPGYVPPECRNGVIIEATLQCDEKELQSGTVSVVGYVNADYEYSLEDPDGYQFIGITVGTSTELLDAIPADMITPNANLKVTFHYQRLYPTMVGMQQTAVSGGTYSMRVLAVTDHIKCQDLGFRVKLEWSDASGEHEVEYYRECKYVYDSVSWSGGTVSAESLGGKKLFAYQLDGIPAAQSDIKVTITPFYIKGVSNQNRKLAEDTTMVFVLNDLPTHNTGDPNTDRDEVDFEYDNSLPEAP